jgi:hypothetical protein
VSGMTWILLNPKPLTKSYTATPSQPLMLRRAIPKTGTHGQGAHAFHEANLSKPALLCMGGLACMRD